MDASWKMELADPLPLRLEYDPAILNGEECRVLHQTVLSLPELIQRSIRLFGKDIPEPRLTAFFSEYEYKYSGRVNEARPMPAAFIPLLTRLREKCKVEFNAVLVNVYRDGDDYIGWHADSEAGLGPVPKQDVCIASVSIGAIRTFEIRPKDTKNSHSKTLSKCFKLPSGSLLVMRGRTQNYWKHRVPKLPLGSRDSDGPRVNLTFRVVLSPDIGKRRQKRTRTLEGCDVVEIASMHGKKKSA